MLILVFLNVATFEITEWQFWFIAFAGGMVVGNLFSNKQEKF